MPRWTHVDDPISVGQRLREARQKAVLSQRQLAFPGCTAVYICRIEKGQRVPSLQVLRELAARTGVSEAWLAKGIDPSEEEIRAFLEQRVVEALKTVPSENLEVLGRIGVKASFSELITLETVLTTIQGGLVPR